MPTYCFIYDQADNIILFMSFRIFSLRINIDKAIISNMERETDENWIWK